MKNRSMTEGSVWKSIIFFALPLIGTSFIQQLYNTADLIFVGHFLGKIETAAVGASSLFVTCLIGLFSGISVGTGVLTGMAFGKKDYIKLNQVIQNAIAVAMACGFLVTLLGYLGAPYFLTWLRTPLEAQVYAVSYLRIYFLSSVAILVYNMSSSVIRAVGDSKSPMYYQLVGGVLNIIFNAVFIIMFKWGVVGVALSTLASQSVTAILALHRLSHLDENFGFTLKRRCLDGPVVHDIVKLGIPIGLQALVITLSNVFVQYNVNQLGLNEVAAFTAYFKVELLIYLPILAIGQSVSAFTSQNIGAKQYERIKEGTRVGLTLGMVLSTGLILFVLVFKNTLLGFILVDSEPLALGERIINITVPFYGLYLVLEVLGSIVRGGGKTFVSMVIILFNICIMRSVLLYGLISYSKSIEMVAMVYPLTWGLTAFMMFLYYLKWQRQRKAE